MPKFISDAEMSQLEKSKPSGKFISDDEMSKLESRSAPEPTDAKSRVIKGGLPAAAIRKGMQGLLGGYYDEAVGAIGAIPKSLMEGKGIGDSYREGRDEIRGLLGETEAQYPKTSSVANIAGAIAGPGKLVKGAKGALVAGGLLGLGESKADLTKGEVGRAALDTGVGTVAGGVGYGLAKAAEPLLKPIAKKISGGLTKVSGKLAEKATGATGKQLEKFAPGAGEELLEKGIVRFGDSPKNIAGRAGSAMDEAATHMNSVLKSLDDAGVEATPGNILKHINDRIEKLGKHSGDADQAAALTKIKDTIVLNLRDSKAPGAALANKPLSWVEGEKQSFNRNLNWNDPVTTKAKKEAYRSMMDVTEDVATKANPKLAQTFKDAKKNYGLLAPIEEAASKRAAQLQQMPWGGLLDVATGTGGVLSGSPEEGMGLIAARRLLAPRSASSAAVTTKALAEMIKKSPGLLQRLAPLLGAKKAAD